MTNPKLTVQLNGTKLTPGGNELDTSSTDHLITKKGQFVKYDLILALMKNSMGGTSMLLNGRINFNLC